MMKIYATKIHTIISDVFPYTREHYLNYLQTKFTCRSNNLHYHNTNVFESRKRPDILVDKVAIAIIHFTILFTIGQC